MAAKKPKAAAEAAPPQKKAPGRPAYVASEADRDKVAKMAGFGMKHDVIAAIMGISDETLRKHYRAELDTGLGAMIYAVGNSLYEKALSDRPDATNAGKFLMQAHAGWSEKNTTVVEPGDALTNLLESIDGRTRSLRKKD